MLSAKSTRDLNKAARAAAKYLKEQGIEVPHAKALDLVARLVGKPQHMAAQAMLPAPELVRPVRARTYAELKNALETLSEAQLAMPLAAANAATDEEFFPVCRLMRGSHWSKLVDEPTPFAAEQPVMHFEDAEHRITPTLDMRNDVIEDLARLLAHKDLQPTLDKEALVDVARDALAYAAPYVDDSTLEQFSRDVLQSAYDALPVGCAPDELLAGRPCLELTVEQQAYATRLAKLLTGQPLRPVDDSPEQPYESDPESAVLGEPYVLLSAWRGRYALLWDALASKARAAMEAAAAELARDGYRTQLLDWGDENLGLNLYVWQRDGKIPDATYEFVLIDGSVEYGALGAAVSASVVDATEDEIVCLSPTVGTTGFATEPQYFEADGGAWHDTRRIVEGLKAACKASAAASDHGWTNRP